MTSPETLPPGTTLGVMGGGQLGMMFALAAKRLGYRTMIVDPDPSAPALRVADRPMIAPYSDPAILRALSEHCSAITTEFENVPSASLAFLEKTRRVRPSSLAVAICQDRISEKTFLRENGFRTASFLSLTPSSLPASGEIAPLLPGILKASREGYDGKGQWSITSEEELLRVLQTFSGYFVLEKKLDLKAELSIILARSATGQVAFFPVVENIHESGILNYSIAPARISDEISDEARRMAAEIACRLTYTGVLSVEFFLDTNDRLHINELAPRPHNSGHYTLDACMTSQFEQQVRVLAGLPLGGTDLLIPSVMGNLLGHLWHNGPPDLESILSSPTAKLYLYGKDTAREGRKMGHFTVLDHNQSQAFSLARKILSELSFHSIRGPGQS